MNHPFPPLKVGVFRDDGHCWCVLVYRPSRVRENIRLWVNIVRYIVIFVGFLESPPPTTRRRRTTYFEGAVSAELLQNKQCVRDFAKNPPNSEPCVAVVVCSAIVSRISAPAESSPEKRRTIIIIHTYPPRYDHRVPYTQRYTVRISAHCQHRLYWYCCAAALLRRGPSKSRFFATATSRQSVL